MSCRIPLALAIVTWLLCLAGTSPTWAAVQKPDELPAGKGREILEASCTSCHDLDEVTKLRGKLGRDEWQGLVKTMMDYGAQVSAKDVDVLVDYLDQHFGKPKTNGQASTASAPTHPALPHSARIGLQFSF